MRIFGFNLGRASSPATLPRPVRGSMGPVVPGRTSRLGALSVATSLLISGAFPTCRAPVEQAPPVTVAAGVTPAGDSPLLAAIGGLEQDVQETLSKIEAQYAPPQSVEILNQGLKPWGYSLHPQEEALTTWKVEPYQNLLQRLSDLRAKMAERGPRESSIEQELAVLKADYDLLLEFDYVGDNFSNVAYQRAFELMVQFRSRFNAYVGRYEATRLSQLNELFPELNVEVGGKLLSYPANLTAAGDQLQEGDRAPLYDALQRETSILRIDFGGRLTKLEEALRTTQPLSEVLSQYLRVLLDIEAYMNTFTVNGEIPHLRFDKEAFQAVRKEIEKLAPGIEAASSEQQVSRASRMTISEAAQAFKDYRVDTINGYHETFAKRSVTEAPGYLVYRFDTDDVLPLPARGPAGRSSIYQEAAVQRILGHLLLLLDMPTDRLSAGINDARRRFVFDQTHRVLNDFISQKDYKDRFLREEYAKGFLGPISSAMLRAYQDMLVLRRAYYGRSAAALAIQREQEAMAIGGETYSMLLADVGNPDASLTEINRGERELKLNNFAAAVVEIKKLLVGIYLNTDDPILLDLIEQLQAEGPKTAYIFTPPLVQLLDRFIADYSDEIELETLRLAYLGGKGLWPPLELQEDRAKFRLVVTGEVGVLGYKIRPRTIITALGLWQEARRMQDSFERLHVQQGVVGRILSRVLDAGRFSKRLRRILEEQPYDHYVPYRKVRIDGMYYRGIPPSVDWIQQIVSEGNFYERVGPTGLSQVGARHRGETGVLMPGLVCYREDGTANATLVREGTKGEAVLWMRTAMVVLGLLNAEVAKREESLYGNYLVGRVFYPEKDPQGNLTYRETASWRAIRNFQRVYVPKMYEEELGSPVDVFSRLGPAGAVIRDAVDQYLANMSNSVVANKRRLHELLPEVEKEWRTGIIGPSTSDALDFALKRLKNQDELDRMFHGELRPYRVTGTGIEELDSVVPKKNKGRAR